MSVVEPPSRKPGDELDELLRRFFRSQLPQPWPALRLPASEHPRWPALGRSLARSRWALAASVALLLLSSLLLPSRFTSNVSSENGPGDQLIADNPQRLHKQHNKHNKAENKVNPGRAVNPADQLPDPDDSDFPSLK